MKTLTAVVLSLLALPAFAQKEDEKTQSDRHIHFMTVREDSALVSMLDKDRPHGNKDIPVPHFAIRTPDNKFVLSIGGQINPIVGVDMGNNLYDQAGAAINFVTNSIPVPSVRGKRSDFYISALNADIDFQVLGLGGTPDQITGYIRFGTDGTTNKILMKDAYLSWRGFTAGMKTTMFQDAAASQPPTIDPQGPSGEIGGTAYEVSYTTPAWRGFRAAVGVAMPTYYHSSGRYHGYDYQEWPFTDAEGKMVCDPTAFNQNVPDIPLWVEWAASPNNRIRVSAIIRNFLYRDEVTQKKCQTVGWGIQLSGNWQPVEPLILYLQAVYGEGIGNYIQDLSGLPLSFTPSNEHLGKMSANPMMGLNLGLTYNISPKWQVNAMASEARIWDVAPYAKANTEDPGNFNNYRYGFYAAGNVFYNISSYFQVGLEYIYGRRGTWGVGSASDSRLQTQFQLTF